MVPLAGFPGWGKDYADPYTFIGFTHDGRNILTKGNTNFSLVGLTAERAGEMEKEGNFSFPVPVDSIPSVDGDIDACQDVTDPVDRVPCWVELDRKLMEEVVPWIPYLDASSISVTSDSVTRYEYDQFSGQPSIVHMAVRGSRTEE